MLGLDDQMVADPHPPRRYRELAAGCAWLKLHPNTHEFAPESRLILARAHGPGFPQLLVYDVLARYPWWTRRVWIDISATGLMLAGSPFAEQFAWVLRKVGTDRVVFGSDFPLDDPQHAAAAVSRLGFTDEEQQATLHDNAAGLLRPDPAG